jgi:hypothetical protein
LVDEPVAVAVGGQVDAAGAAAPDNIVGRIDGAVAVVVAGRERRDSGGLGSQIFIIPSSLIEAIRLPRGLHSRMMTDESWARKRMGLSFAEAIQVLIVPSVLAEAIRASTGLHRRVYRCGVAAEGANDLSGIRIPNLD